MKERGNERFKSGDYFDALWKYQHSLTLASNLKYTDPNETMAIVHSNISACCLKLGDDDRIDLLRSVEGFSIHQTTWYNFGYQHAHNAILLDPPPKVAGKVGGIGITCSASDVGRWFAVGYVAKI